MGSQDGLKTRMRLDALQYARSIIACFPGTFARNCERALRDDHASYVALKVDPSRYSDPLSFFIDYQSAKLLAKYPALKTGVDTRAAAERKFIDAEHQCLLTNRRIQSCVDGGHDSRRVAFLFDMQRKISTILGPAPRFEDLDYEFGPGANVNVRVQTASYNKLTAGLQCTHNMVGILPEFLAEFPGWVPDQATVELVPSNQLGFVPKDCKTDRPICIEPLLNGLLQKGLGSHLRRRLSLFGVNLDDQEINQRLAQKAYSSELATIDFSSASDTVSYSLILNLLPIDWVGLLDSCRSPNFSYQGSVYPLQKWSSMGNAYTFELETLVFYALAVVSCEWSGIPYQTQANLHVYGDDVIIPRAAFDIFSDVSEWLGFTINLEKSFSQGDFFESCGADYFKGINVRPFLLKRKLHGYQECFYAINTVQRLASQVASIGRQSGLTTISSPIVARLLSLHRRLVGLVPRRHRLFGPEHSGDGHIVAPLDIAMSSGDVRWDHNLCLWRWKTYTFRPSLIRKDEWPMSYALYHAKALGDNLSLPSEGFSVRGRGALSVARVLSRDWLDPYFPWTPIECLG